ncbi:MAG: hypothetical protein JWM11_4131 [Planctomycetaceae bacterium]|nr:hypothetical protein [Planctomycetaceae bacterium]
MEVTRRDWLAAAAFAGIVPGLALGQEATPTAKPAAAPGALSEETLKKLLEAINLKPTQSQSRFDFAFVRKPKGGEDWNLSMSAVLSSDGKSIWIMAWLDELPRSSRDVPRTALLKLLAENDVMGEGKFFSYIPANRRFALQQVIENHDMTTKKFHATLVSLGDKVIETYSFWSTEAWKDPTGVEASPSSDPNAGQQTTQTNSNTVNQPASQTGRPAANTTSCTSGAATARPRTSTKSATPKQ